MKENLEHILESILFVSGNPVEITFLCEKLQLSRKEMDKVIAALKEKHSGDSGIHLITFKEKLQFASNPKYVEDVSEVLNPIREKELTKSMLETISIVAYKQPITRLEVEDIRGVDCTYALQTLSKMKLITVVGRKDAVGKPLLFGTTDEFLKRFSLSGLSDLPDYEELTDRIKTVMPERSDTLFDTVTDDSFVLPDEEIPDFLENEQVDVIE
jgi:segregation and condensation protein B